MPAIMCSGGALSQNEIKKIKESVITADNTGEKVFKDFSYNEEKIIDYLSNNNISYNQWNEYFSFFKYCSNNELTNSLLNANVICSNKLENLLVMLNKIELLGIQEKKNNNRCRR